MSDDPASKEAFRWEVARSLIAALRHEWPGMGDMANEQRMRAASAIEELMATVEAWRHSARKADRDIAQLRDRLEVEESAVNHLHIDRNNLRLAVERLSVERDEARRERDEARMWICRFDAESRSKYARRCGMSDYDYTPLQMAHERGWDCFREKP